jgi:hypothetical protein
MKNQHEQFLFSNACIAFENDEVKRENINFGLPR